jgi:hypothetical protein
MFHGGMMCIRTKMVGSTDFEIAYYCRPEEKISILILPTNIYAFVLRTSL